METQQATFGAGCFWGVEERFRAMPGVIQTEVGYEGGTTDHPTYEDVCSDATGHAEVVRVTFDPDQVSYEQLVRVFWRSHNPTTLNRQGPDEGRQYRSVIFYHSDEQRDIAERSKAEAQQEWRQPIVTDITPATTFWKAEDYHQQYLAKRGLAACHI